MKSSKQIVDESFLLCQRAAFSRLAPWLSGQSPWFTSIGRGAERPQCGKQRGGSVVSKGAQQAEAPLGDYCEPDRAQRDRVRVLLAPPTPEVLIYQGFRFFVVITGFLRIAYLQTICKYANKKAYLQTKCTTKYDTEKRCENAALFFIFLSFPACPGFLRHARSSLYAANPK